MDIRVLNASFGIAGIVDQYESFIWTDRYNEAGDFELYAPVDYNILSVMQLGYYVMIDTSDRVMIVETREIITDEIQGSKLKITGRSLESMLTWRIFWSQTILNGNWQTEIIRCLNENVISPGDPYRQIPNFIAQTSTDTGITSLTVSTQYREAQLYDMVTQQCKANNIGFKVLLNASNQFVFSLYKGVDRSYGQSAVNYVVFSPKFDNLSGSDYVETTVGKANVCMTLGDGQGGTQKSSAVGIDTVAARTGANRREVIINANGVSATLPNGSTMTDAQYLAELDNYGTMALLASYRTIKFEGKVALVQYSYGKDFFLGDIIQVENEYGMQGTSRVMSVIFSKDASGEKVVPTFTAI